ncbi:hypothetical protein OROMI_001374 [Orobanche minor]
MAPQRRLGTYIGYESPTIIHYLEPLTGDLFTTYCGFHFDETKFLLLRGEEKNKFIKELSLPFPTLSHYGLGTSLCDREVQRILDLHNIADSMLDAFADIVKVTRSHIPAGNMPQGYKSPIGGTSLMYQVMRSHLVEV